MRKDTSESTVSSYSNVINESDISEQKTNFIDNDEKKVAEKLKKRLCSNMKSDVQKAVRDSNAIEKKIRDFDERFYQLYEDKLNSVISKDRFIEMSRRCEAEQNDLRVKL